MTDATTQAALERIRPLCGNWPDDLLDSAHPAFISRRHADGSVWWYALARSLRQSRELRDQLLAFIGPSYSAFHGEPVSWQVSDPLEGELAAICPWGFRLEIASYDAATVEKLIVRLRELLRERPRRVRQEPPTLGRMLRDFELFLRAQDWNSARAQLDQLRQRGQLSSTQLAGLRLRWLGAQEKWEELLATPELGELLPQRLPISVAEAIAAAIYNTRLSSAASRVEASVRYRDEIFPTFGPLFRQRAMWRQPTAVQAAKIADAAFAPLTQSQVTAPRTELPLSALPLSAASAAYEAGELPHALGVLLAGPLTVEGVRLLVQVALDMNDREAACSAVAAIRDTDAYVQSQAFQRRATRALWEELQETVGPDDSPGDWTAWLQRATDVPVEQAAAWVREQAHHWPTPVSTAFANVFAERGANAFAAIREVLDEFLKAILPAATTTPALASVYRDLLGQLVVDDQLSHATAPAIGELAAAAMATTPVGTGGKQDAATVLEYLGLAWEQLKGPRQLDWGLELLDSLAAHAAHRQASVNELTLAIIAEFARVSRRITAGQRELLQAIVAELDLAGAADHLELPASEAATETKSLAEKLGNRSIVLLTLHDRIAASFRELMRRRYPAARVDVLQETSGTRRLRDAAASADIFIVNTYDEKHAATTFVKQQRDEQAVTLYPEGKNAGRQLDALETWLRTLP